MTGVEAILTRLGWETAIEHQGEVHRVKAVVQPIPDRSKLYLEADYSALGQLEKGHALYYGPALPYPQQGDFIRFGEEHYFVKQAENFYGKGKALYRWAVLQRAREEEQDD